MSTVDDATATMIANFPAKTGRPLDDWVRLARVSGLTKHGQIVSMLKAEHGMTHGFANFVANRALARTMLPSEDDLVDAMYSGPKAEPAAAPRRRVAIVWLSGPISSWRPRRPTSASAAEAVRIVGPGPGGRLEIGLILGGVEPEGRLEPTTGMCKHRVRIDTREELDGELVGWLRKAYEGA